MEVSERMRRLPQNTCVLLGTWRVDCTESYVLGNTTYMLRDANPTLPVFLSLIHISPSWCYTLCCTSRLVRLWDILRLFPDRSLLLP